MGPGAPQIVFKVMLTQLSTPNAEGKEMTSGLLCPPLLSGCHPFRHSMTYCFPTHPTLSSFPQHQSHTLFPFPSQAILTSNFNISLETEYPLFLHKNGGKYNLTPYNLSKSSKLVAASLSCILPAGFGFSQMEFSFNQAQTEWKQPY